MVRIVTLESLKALPQAQLLELQRLKAVLVVPLEDAEDDYLAYVAERATGWLRGEKIKAIDARRFFEGREWDASMLTSDVLPKTILLDASRWDNSFVEKCMSISMEDFYRSPALGLDYNDASDFIFMFSTFYHHTMVSVTDFCNLRCRGCSFHGDDAARYNFAGSREKERRQELKEEDYFLFLDQLKPGEDLLFCGTGELFVSKKAMPYVREAVKRGQSVRILTNGMLVDEAVAQELVDLGVRAVIFSIDGHTKEIVERIRIGVDFEAVLGNLRGLMDARDRVNSPMSIGVHCGWFDEVKPYKDDIVKFWSDFGVDTFSFFAEKVDWFKSIPMYKEMPIPARSHACFNGIITPVLMTNGLVAPCTGTYQAEWSNMSSEWMKHIQEAPLKEIIQYYRRMRVDHKSPYRQRCAMCIGCYSSYVDANSVSAFADGYRFTDRRHEKEASFVKFVPQSSRLKEFLKHAFGAFLKFR